VHSPGTWLVALALSAASCCTLGAEGTSRSGSADVAAIRVLAACSETQAVADSGLEGLREACPALEQALQELNLTDQLGPDWRETINLATVADLASLALRYQGEPDGIEPRPAALSAVMQSLRVNTPPTSWWQRLKTWLRSLLQQPTQPRGSWLTQLHLPWKPSQLLLRVIDYLLIGSVLLLAVWIVWREVRAARALAPAPRAAAKRGEMALAPELREQSIELPDLQSMPLAQRPSAVLLALIGVLHRSGRLERARALTHRQLTARARFDDLAQRARFERIALLAERCRYGRPEPVNTELLADAVALHRQLAATMGVHA